MTFTPTDTKIQRKIHRYHAVEKKNHRSQIFLKRRHRLLGRLWSNPKEIIEEIKNSADNTLQYCKRYRFCCFVFSIVCLLSKSIINEKEQGKGERNVLFKCNPVQTFATVCFPVCIKQFEKRQPTTMVTLAVQLLPLLFDNQLVILFAAYTTTSAGC